MIPGKSTIDQLFNGTRVFEIPFYQRSYVWGEKQWERLLSDIISVGQKTTDYFLGAIILKQIIAGTAKWGDYKVVIDGQQRLTTLAILLKVLYLKQGLNEWFKRNFKGAIDWFKLTVRRIKDIKHKRYRRCPNCKAVLRLPKRKGTHYAKCPSCRANIKVNITIKIPTKTGDCN